MIIPLKERELNNAKLTIMSFSNITDYPIDLPLDIYQKIFRCIDTTEWNLRTLTVCNLVCHTWRKLLRQSLLVFRNQYILSQNQFQRLLGAFKNLTHLDIYLYHFHQVEVIGGLDQLRTLCLTVEGMKVYDKMWEIPLNVRKQIEILKLRVMSLEAREDIRYEWINTFHRVKYLSYVGPCIKEALLPFLVELKSLERLELDGAFSGNAPLFYSEDINLFHELCFKELILKHCHIARFDGLLACSHLKNVQFYNLKVIFKIID